MKNLIAGNWKMNGTAQDNKALTEAILEGIKQNSSVLARCDFLVCPPFLHTNQVCQLAQNKISVGAQDCSSFKSGAYTGEISPGMLKEIGCTYVIVGHSERRQYHNENNEAVAAKAKAAHEAGLIAIICVGETQQERSANAQEVVVERQVLESLPETTNSQNTVIAYEPVWAIGTGKTASTQDAQEMHSFIRGKLGEKFSDSDKYRILYGGSMKPENAGELLSQPDINGGLIGGASLKADQFLAIALAAPKI